MFQQLLELLMCDKQSLQVREGSAFLILIIPFLGLYGDSKNDEGKRIRE